MPRLPIETSSFKAKPSPPPLQQQELNRSDICKFVFCWLPFIGPGFACCFLRFSLFCPVGQKNNNEWRGLLRLRLRLLDRAGADVPARPGGRGAAGASGAAAAGGVSRRENSGVGAWGSGGVGEWGSGGVGEWGSGRVQQLVPFYPLGEGSPT